jgi:acyl-CoA reductase-like NAD-dependent aldehyde dehydrogenase
MPHIPLLRAGRPYESLATLTLTDIASGEPVAEVSQANAGLVAKDLGSAASNRRALEARSTRELLDISRRAARLFVEETLPLGTDQQTPEDFVRQVSATTGLPRVFVRANMEKARFVMAEMETVLGGLTRGLDLDVLDAGFGTQGQRVVSYRRESDLLGAILPSNSPGVHSLWIPSIPLKTPLALKPGRQEPWTPYRIAQAYLAAGCPPQTFGFYPTDHAGAAEILVRSGRSLLFGDKATVAAWEHDPRVQIHGPGWSKVVLGPDAAQDFEPHLDLIAASIADNGGRSCINASGVWAAGRGRELADAIAARLALITARPLDDPEAALAAFPSRSAAQKLSDYIDAQLAIPGAEDVTAHHRSGPRVAEAGGCWFVLPTLIYCSDPRHPLAQAEFLLPFAAVVERPADELLTGLGATLVATCLTSDASFAQQALASTQIERLNIGTFPTSRIDWTQPHEGNLFEHLYRQRAFQAHGTGPAATTVASGGA